MAREWVGPCIYLFSPRICWQAKYFKIVRTEEKRRCLIVYGNPNSLIWDACASRKGIITGWGYLLTSFEGDLQS